uniref:Uncharacterized protein n=1 Tax=Citrifermentans bremense TaxID=60035 RepID=A0A6S6M0U1_9BACT
MEPTEIAKVPVSTGWKDAISRNGESAGGARTLQEKGKGRGDGRYRLVRSHCEALAPE